MELEQKHKALLQHIHIVDRAFQAFINLASEQEARPGTAVQSLLATERRLAFEQCLTVLRSTKAGTYTPQPLGHHTVRLDTKGPEEWSNSWNTSNTPTQHTLPEGWRYVGEGTTTLVEGSTQNGKLAVYIKASDPLRFSICFADSQITFNVPRAVLEILLKESKP